MKPFSFKPNTLSEWLLCTLMLLLPFNGVIAAKRIAMASLLVCGFVQIFRHRADGASPSTALVSIKRGLCVLAPVLGLAAYQCLSLLWSALPNNTAHELRSDVLIPLLGMVGIVLAKPSSEGLVRISIAALAGFVLSALIAVPGVLMVGIAQRTDFLYPLVHGEGQYSTIAVLMLMPMAYVYLQGAHRNLPQLKHIALVTFIIQLAVGYISFVRMFWLANLCVLFTLWCGVRLLAVFKPRLIEQQRKQYAALALFLAIHLLGYWVVGLQKPVNYLYESAIITRPQTAIASPSVSYAAPPIILQPLPAHPVQPPSASETQSAPRQALPAPVETLLKNERYEIWQFWWLRILERPWLGYGFGMTVPPDVVRSQMPSHWPVLFGAHAHNRMLNILAQTGALGLLIWCVFHAVLLRRWSAALHSINTDAALAASVSIALVVAYVAKSMTDDYMSRNPLLIYWLFVALFGMVRGHFMQEEP